MALVLSSKMASTERRSQALSGVEVRRSASRRVDRHLTYREERTMERTKELGRKGKKVTEEKGRVGRGEAVKGRGREVIRQKKLNWGTHSGDLFLRQGQLKTLRDRDQRLCKPYGKPYGVL